MKVTQSTSNPIQSSDTKGAKAAGKAHAARGTDKAAASKEPHDTSAVKSEVSDRAREMATAKAAATDAPDVREEKIAALKARIAAGKYNVKNEEVADRMVDDHIRMSGIG
jgi:negative regulator of flagellin synthesis FlgM